MDDITPLERPVQRPDLVEPLRDIARLAGQIAQEAAAEAHRVGLTGAWTGKDAARFDADLRILSRRLLTRLGEIPL